METIPVKRFKKEMEVFSIKIWVSLLFLTAVAIAGLILGIVAITRNGSIGPEGPEGPEGPQGSNGTSISYETETVLTEFQGPWASSIFANVTYTLTGNVVTAFFPSVTDTVSGGGSISTSEVPSEFLPDFLYLIHWPAVVMEDSSLVEGRIVLETAAFLFTPFATSFDTGVCGILSTQISWVKSMP